MRLFTGSVINHITPFWVQGTFECTNALTHARQCQALLWLPYHTALVVPSCFPHAFHCIVPPMGPPMGPIISCRTYFTSWVQVSLRRYMCACLLLSTRWENERKREREFLAGSIHIQFLSSSRSTSYQSVIVLFRGQGFRCQSQRCSAPTRSEWLSICQVILVIL